jgi:hypothetical protein
MNSGRMVFAQLLDFLPKHEFHKCVQRYCGQHRLRKFSCFDQFLCMAYAQLTGRDSLRNLEICLRVLRPKLYHAGFRGEVSRSTLADANHNRDWRIYADFAHVLIGQARALYADDAFAVDLDQAAYAFDSTTIDLCLALFPWAKFRRRKGAVKLHTMIDLRGNIPCFIHITHGKTHDVNALDHLSLEAGAFYMLDRGYIDFRRLAVFARRPAFFVTRSKKNLDCERRCSRQVDKSTGLRCDQTIVLKGIKSARDYPDSLRRISYVDNLTEKRLVFLTNNFNLPAIVIPQLYKCRWQVELFFKWIKQHLCIKSFLGNSENAVKTQVWIAISVYALVAILKKQLRLDNSPNEIHQILGATLFEKTLVSSMFSCENHLIEDPSRPKQLSLFDF